VSTHYSSLFKSLNLTIAFVPHVRLVLHMHTVTAIRLTLRTHACTHVPPQSIVAMAFDHLPVPRGHPQGRNLPRRQSTRHRIQPLPYVSHLERIPSQSVVAMAPAFLVAIAADLPPRVAFALQPSSVTRPREPVPAVRLTLGGVIANTRPSQSVVATASNQPRGHHTSFGQRHSSWSFHPNRKAHPVPIILPYGPRVESSQITWHGPSPARSLRPCREGVVQDH
jgi:hypothetical protein